MDECKKWKILRLQKNLVNEHQICNQRQHALCVCSVAQSCLTLETLWTVTCQVPLCLRILQVRILEWIAKASSRGSAQPRIEPRSPTLQADSLPSESPEKPKNPGMGSLSLLQGIFPTQCRGVLHCRQILYQQSHQGSPMLVHSACHKILPASGSSFWSVSAKNAFLVSVEIPSSGVLIRCWVLYLSVPSLFTVVKCI